ncbi:MAG: hypothetical protein NT033_00135 [Candidatus Omnitrophica bacterium]|nr:hypothetical protein [Candidatus Omnitrophota bacterium]
MLKFINALIKLIKLVFLDTIFGNRTGINFGQVWKATKDYKIPEEWSSQKGCIIPKNTRVVVLNAPVYGALGFYIMPLTSKGLDKRLTPNLKQMEIEKEGFGVTINIEYFKQYFVLDDDQKIVFDNSDAEEFWNRVKTHR